MLTAGVVLLNDDTCPHTARSIVAVDHQFDHPRYIPDLAPCNFHIFLHLEKFPSSGVHFDNNNELKTFVTCWFHLQTAEF